mgnify:CR=1 FL=1
MPLIIPFRGLRPAPGRATEVAAPPYDVMNASEARSMVEGRPWSFLHISRPEVDLRGLRVDEIEQALLPAVDAAHVVDLPSLRIIHGKGTFALREEVGRLLAGDRRIDRLRPGGFEEGGSGVTVVEFRRGGE